VPHPPPPTGPHPNSLLPMVVGAAGCHHVGMWSMRGSGGVLVMTELARAAARLWGSVFFIYYKDLKFKFFSSLSDFSKLNLKCYHDHLVRPFGRHGFGFGFAVTNSRSQVFVLVFFFLKKHTPSSDGPPARTCPCFSPSASVVPSVWFRSYPATALGGWFTSNLCTEHYLAELYGPRFITFLKSGLRFFI